MIIIQSFTNLIPDSLIKSISDAVAEQAVDDIATYARAYWVELAQEGLQSTAQSYIKGISDVRVDPGTNRRRITLTGAMAMSIEEDQAAYDMRKTLLGPSVPVVPKGSGMKGKHQNKQGGFYRAIPFYHQGPNTAGVGGTPIGKPYMRKRGLDVQKMADSIFAAAKKLKATKGVAGQRISYGGRLPAGMAPKLKRHHKTDIYAGMIRQSKFYRKVAQSKMTTFRMISTTSGHAKSWMRKATRGKQYARKVANEVKRSIAPAVFKAILSKSQG
jgi:hypothetical protein